MNEYIFYTAEGSTIAPNENIEVENCQVLGRALGNNVEEAQENLIKDNPWIANCGYDIEKAFSKQLLTEIQKFELAISDEVREFLVELLDKRQLEQYEKWLIAKGW